MGDATLNLCHGTFWTSDSGIVTIYRQESIFMLWGGASSCWRVDVRSVFDSWRHYRITLRFWFAWNVHGFTLHTVKCVFHNQLKAILQRFWQAACLQMAYFSIKWHGGTESWHIWCNVMVASLYHWTVSNGLPLIQDTPVRQSSYKENHFRLVLTSFSFPTHCLTSLAL